MKLTIAIPTYNRNTILKKNLEFILPELTANCKLLILDNCSDIPVSESIKHILNRFPDANVEIIRNRFNIGLTGNVLRCFELCTTPWLWVLGDDDEVKNGAIEQIFSDIRKHKNLLFINYAWSPESLLRKESTVTKGIDNFLDSFENIGTILFISSGIYNTIEINKKIAFGNFFQTTYAPHLAMVFLSIGNEGKCLLSRECIVINKSFDTPDKLKWDQIYIYQITGLLRLPLSPSAIHKLKKQLEPLTRVWTISHLITILVYIGYEEQSNLRTRILYDDISRGFFYLDRRLQSKIILLVGFILVRYPEIFKPFLRVIYKVARGKEFEPIRNLRI